MTDQKPEKISRGCAALGNLFFSGILLLILILILVPGWVELPAWVKNLKNLTLIEKRQAWATPQTFTLSEREKADNLLIFNTRFRGTPLSDLISQNRNLAQQETFLAYKATAGMKPIWEIKLDNTPIQGIEKLKNQFDFNNLYLVDGSQLKCFDRSKGQLQWSRKLSDVIHPDCVDCLQVTLNKIGLVLTQDQILYGIDLMKGKVLWENRLNTPDGFGRGLYHNQENVWVIDQTSANPDAPAELKVFGLKDGALLQRYTLDSLDFYSPFFWYDGQLYGFGKDKNQNYFLLNYDLSGKMRWQTALPNGFVPPSVKIKTNKFAQNEWFLSNGKALYISLTLPNQLSQLWKFAIDDGRSTLLLEDDTYQFFLLGESGNQLIINVFRKRGSAKNEIWLLEKNGSRISVKYPLRTIQKLHTGKRGREWAVNIRQNKLVVLDFVEHSGTLFLTWVNLNDGSTFAEHHFSVKNDVWSGVAWTQQQVFLTIRNLYRLDLDSNTLFTEFP
ncbi:MAG: PQQ-binding-like beta-propeller repeat protein [Microscillaceae bacterium]|jgi:hypothetical protein|nr:PQQ-binding-like beta-propeller repeat protein [Microscillaceae bacterium]